MAVALLLEACPVAALQTEARPAAVLLWEARTAVVRPAAEAAALQTAARWAQRLRERVAQLEAEIAHDRRQGRHDGERAPHRWRGSLSPDRHQFHYGVPAIIRNGG
jgi:hypothetical protein